jgi:hypothetical protein
MDNKVRLKVANTAEEQALTVLATFRGAIRLSVLVGEAVGDIGWEAVGGRECNSSYVVGSVRA